MSLIGCFAETIPIDLPYDPVHRYRALPLAEQSALRARLAGFRFDLAVDFCFVGHSRPLLRLSGARFTAGFQPREFPWLSVGVDVQTCGPLDGSGRAAHATALLTLVEAIGALVTHRPMIVPPAGTAADVLSAIGVERGRYAVLHTGARYQPQRWPLAHYLDLARRIVQATQLQVVLFVDGAAEGERAARAGLPPERCRILVGQREFCEFDALLAHCAVFVGNDSGPKHLAALRGAKVVSIHGGRIAWGEWGQEGDGLIVARRVPCQGCGAEEMDHCGQDLACLTHIKPEEVMGAVHRLLGNGGFPSRP